MPFKIPYRLPSRARIRPSNPSPPSGVMISLAYVGLTVVTASAYTTPPFVVGLPVGLQLIRRKDLLWQTGNIDDRRQ